jgi:hypothetical protein
VTIDTIEFSPHVVLGTARLQLLDGVALEYAEASRRTCRPEQGDAWVNQVAQLALPIARIRDHPGPSGLGKALPEPRAAG